MMRKVRFLVITLLFAVVTAQAQKVEIKKSSKEEKLYVKVKDGEKPAIYVDGKKFDFPMELIDQSKIESVAVFKDQDSLRKYNEPNGVIFIKTKIIIPEVNVSEFRDKSGKIMDSKNAPMIILDGVVTTKDILDKLDPNDIESMNVVKGEKALKKYNAPNGVIIITSKKKKSKE
jgi:hypothetical protein